MRTLVFILVMLLMGLALVINLIGIGAAFSKRVDTGSRWAAMGINVVLISCVIYLYNTSVGD